MYVTVIQGKGKIGFLDCFEIKDKLKKLGSRWHPHEAMWVLTTSDDITTVMKKIDVHGEDYRLGDVLDCNGPQSDILFG